MKGTAIATVNVTAICASARPLAALMSPVETVPPVWKGDAVIQRSNVPTASNVVPINAVLRVSALMQPPAPLTKNAQADWYVTTVNAMKPYPVVRMTDALPDGYAKQ